MTDLATRLAEDVVFILVQPQHPGNVGATARAMKNMGLRRLIVVDPAPSFDLERARWMAPGAGMVLDQMRIVSTLDEAVEGIHRLVATTARHRKFAQPVYEPAPLAEQWVASEPGTVTGILFGREDMGLSREHTLRAESLLRIATDHHASLNLAQAVLLTAHHFFETARAHGHEAEGRIVGGSRKSRSTRSLQHGAKVPLADVTKLEPAVVELVAMLNRVGFDKGSNMEKVGVMVREGLQRSALTVKQVSAIRGMVRRVEYALDHPDIDWRASKKQNALRAAVNDANDPSNDEGSDA